MRHRHALSPSLLLCAGLVACGSGGDAPAPTAVAGAAQVAAPAASSGPPNTGGAGGLAAPAVSAGPTERAPAPIPAAGAEGTWTGTATDRAVAGVVLEDGSYWLAWSRDRVVEGLLQGGARSADGRLASDGGRIVDLALGVRDAVLSADYEPARALDGRATDAAGGALELRLRYAPSYEQPATFAATTGEWTASLAGNEALRVRIDPTGIVTGRSDGGCDLSGWLAPRASNRGTWSLFLAFGGPPCGLGAATLTGVGAFVPGTDGDPPRLLVIGLDEGRQAGFGALLARVGEPPPPPGPDSPAAEAERRAVRALLVDPAFGAPGSNTVTLEAGDGSGSRARLLAATAAEPDRYRTWITSWIDEARAVTVFFRGRRAPDGGAASVDAVGVEFDGASVPLAGAWSAEPDTREPPDAALATFGDAAVRADLLLARDDAVPGAYRVCWRVRSDTVDRTVCSVAGQAGRTGLAVEGSPGAARTYR